MSTISITAKKSIIKQALDSSVKDQKAVAKKNNIGYSTLKRWIRDSKAGVALESCPTSTTECSSADKLEHLLSTNGLDETELGSYCRRQGIYSHQLLAWKEEFVNQKSDNKRQKAIKELKAENKRLKKDLARKDKALAETSALLILKKKANLLWGEDEDV